MEFAKLSHARYPLGASGVKGMTLKELGASMDDIEINNPGGGYGYPPLLERIAHYCGVAPEKVVCANGCSMAYHLAYAATFDPGDDVLIEQPAYEVMMTAAQFLGANVRRFQRRYENGFAVDPQEIERQLTPRTRLIVLCNLHNPSSALTGNDTLRAIGDLARSVGARVLVDEVYLEAVFPRPRTAALLGPELVVASSLTKAYGLSGLRCGWILAEPELARRVWRLNDLFGVHQPHASDRLSVLAFDRMDRVAARAERLLNTNRPIMLDFLRSRDELDCFIPEHGTVLFPRLKRGNVDELARLLREKYETMIVPGSYFEMPQHFRLGIGIDTELMREGLKRLGTALDQS
jgi:aspartate/methionine/tyrosine aminotransferase